MTGSGDRQESRTKRAFRTDRIPQRGPLAIAEYVSKSYPCGRLGSDASEFLEPRTAVGAVSER